MASRKNIAQISKVRSHQFPPTKIQYFNSKQDENHETLHLELVIGPKLHIAHYVQ